MRNMLTIISYQAINNLFIEFPTILMTTPPKGLIPLLNQMLLFSKEIHLLNVQIT